MNERDIDWFLSQKLVFIGRIESVKESKLRDGMINESFSVRADKVLRGTTKPISDYWVERQEKTLCGTPIIKGESYLIRIGQSHVEPINIKKMIIKNERISIPSPSLDLIKEGWTERVEAFEKATEGNPSDEIIRTRLEKIIRDITETTTSAFTGKIEEIQSDLPAFHSIYQTLTVTVEKALRGKSAAVMKVKVMRRRPDGQVSPDYQIGETVRCEGTDTFICEQVH